MKEKVKETSAFLAEKGFTNAEVGIILGTGLGALVDEIKIEKSLSYEDIPNFPVSTVEFHYGKLLFGELSGKKVIAMQGRFHYYEGYSLSEIVFPVRVMSHLGVKALFISNAGGNMNLDWKKGQLMLITDHINLLPDNPLRGKQGTEFGNIFVDLSEPYDLELNDKMRKAAFENSVTLNEGVYVAVSGPNLETKAEYRYLRMIGADVVGMSTIPEVIAANQIGLPVCAISVLTDDCDPDNLEPVVIADILDTAKKAEVGLVKVLKTAIGNF